MDSTAKQQDSSPMAGGSQFRTTRWTRVCRAGKLACPTATEALADLYRQYWYPLYAFVRRKGYSPEDAQDLTQSFFTRLLEKEYLQLADPKRGRFRTFLCSSLSNFLNNEWDKKKTVKRGGQCFFVSWEELGAEDRYRQEPFSELDAAKLFERRWAMTILEKTMETVRQEYLASGDLPVFEALHGLLTGATGEDSLKDLAVRLNLTEEAVRMRVHRLRRRFGKVLREIVEDTVDDGQVDDEVRYLFAMWS